MSYELIVEAITNLGFPIVVTVGLIFWLVKYAFPRVTDMIDGIIDDFREEMDAERRFHSENIRLLIDTGRSEHQEIKELIRNGRKDNYASGRQ